MSFGIWLLIIGCIGSAFGDILVSPSPQNVSVGQVFNLNVGVNSITDLYAYQFDLSFDPNVLDATSVTEGNYLNSGGPTLFIPGAIDNVAGFVFATADSLEGLSGISGSGDLADFTFRAIAAGNTGINIQQVFLLDSSLSVIDANVTNGNVNVVMATPEPSSVMLLGLATGVFLFWGPRSIRIGEQIVKELR